MPSISIHSITDPGLVRPNNEDFYLFSRDYRIIIVADGVGGYEYGEVASRIAAESCYALLENEFSESHYLIAEDPEEALNRAVVFANKKVVEEKVQKPSHKNMGTTLTCIYLDDEYLYFSYVGDSRVYLIDTLGKKILRLTTDHTLAEQQAVQNEISGHVYRNSRHILTRMIGASSSVSPSSGRRAIAGGNLILSCTDGLSDLVSEENILATVIRFQDDSKACLESLLAQVKENGARDNITIVLARCL